MSFASIDHLPPLEQFRTRRAECEAMIEKMHEAGPDAPASADTRQAVITSCNCMIRMYDRLIVQYGGTLIAPDTDIEDLV